jgi:LysM repeat protein
MNKQCCERLSGLSVPNSDHRLPKRAHCWWLVWLVVGLVACTPSTPNEPTVEILSVTTTATATTPPSLPTSTPTFMPPRTTPTLSPTPTATPFLHTIVQGDTLLGIALRYQVEMTDLVSANPGVDPGFLSIGEHLVVPLEETLGPPPVAATPYPVFIDAPVCYPTSAGELWCLALVKNDQDRPVEGLGAQFTLYNRLGEGLATGGATAPLNLLLPGGSLPLVVFFEAAPTDFAYATADLTVAFPAGDLEQRYLPMTAVLETLDLAHDGMGAFVTGSLLNQDEHNRNAVGIRLVAWAINTNGKLVGFRLWESNEALVPGQALPFELILYCLGDEIDQVQLMVEARPSASESNTP